MPLDPVTTSDVGTPFAGGGQQPLGVASRKPAAVAPSAKASVAPVAVAARSSSAPVAAEAPDEPFPDSCPPGIPQGQACVVTSAAAADGSVTAAVAAHAFGDLTVGFHVTGDNLRVTGVHELVTVHDGRAVSVAHIGAFDPSQKWHYDYTFHFVRGDVNASYDGTVLKLPFERGTAHLVVQGWNGTFSHVNEDATDWAMPIGTTILAARGGLVVETRADATESGTDPAFKDNYPVNAIYIRHDDATIGVYLHLDTNGVLVKPGQRVETGEPIGLSGNTGYSTRPHLHFEVLAPKDDTGFHTFPALFQLSTDDPKGGQPLEGQVYTAF